MLFADNAVNECVKMHKHCRAPKRPPLPRRVLDVVDFDNGSDVRLWQSNGKRAAYVALSHTWGQKHTFMTNRSNLRERLRGIKFQSLPKTFQDAIFMTRKLKIRYLWIDSLCILQGDTVDWNRESPKMGAVYGNAYITIAAGSALNDQTGFLGPRSDSMYRDFILETKVGQCSAVTRVQDMTAPSRRDPLSFRAWAFQERLLSRRMLYYHQQELVFECREEVRCECMSCARVIERYRQNDSKFWERMGLKSEASGFPRVQIPKSANPQELLRFWRECIVPEYSARSISRDSDRLPALSAVAAAVQALSGNQYLGGMWQQWLPSELAWTSVRNSRTRTGDRVLATLPKCYVAPSWCWASINGPVRYKHLDDGESLDYRVEVVHAECGISSMNPFGDVDSGSITLKGAVIYGVCELQADPEKLWPYRIKLFFPIQTQMTLGFEPDVTFLAEAEIRCQESVLFEDAPEAWLNIGTTLKRGRLPGDQEGSATRPATFSYGSVSCLLLCTSLQQSRSEWKFLVLGQSSEVSGAYQRLGMLACWVNGYTEWGELDNLEPQIVAIV